MGGGGKNAFGLSPSLHQSPPGLEIPPERARSGFAGHLLLGQAFEAAMRGLEVGAASPAEPALHFQPDILGVDLTPESSDLITLGVCAVFSLCHARPP